MAKTAPHDPQAQAHGQGHAHGQGLFSGHGPRRWLIGSGIASLILVLGNGGSLVAKEGVPSGLWWVLLAAFVAAFMVGPPLGWQRSETFRVLSLLLFFGLSLTFIAPEHGVYSGTWLWTFVAVFLGSQGHPRGFVFIALTLLCGTAILLNTISGVPISDAFSQSVSIGSLGLMMFAFSRQIRTIRELRSTQNKLAELAVITERNRVARDMHDILGHSLTVIAVKAELAGRLLEAAPEKAAAEIADVESLARGALLDVRATVSGYRGVNVISELANARSALLSAGVDPDLPGAADEVAAQHRELFGWVLREGVTNVIRHADASKCKVSMGADFIQIDDDGVGPLGRDGLAGGLGLADSFGNGLKGIMERASDMGAAISIGRSDLGGFKVRLSL